MSVAASLPSGDRRTELDFDHVYQQNLRFVWRALVASGVPEWRLEDAAQDVFAAVHARLGEFEGRSKLTTWLYGIARHVALDHIRKAARERRRARELFVKVGAGEGAPSSPEEEVGAAQARRLLLDLLDRIQPTLREVFVLVELEQVPVREVAAMLAIKENTAWSRLRLARAEFERQVARVRARDEEGSR